MTVDEVKEVFGKTGYMLRKNTKLHHVSYASWTKKGYIPMKTQLKLAGMSGGRLVPRIEDSEFIKLGFILDRKGV